MTKPPSNGTFNAKLHVRDAKLHVWDVKLYVWDAKLHVWDVKLYVWDAKIHVWDAKIGILDAKILPYKKFISTSWNNNINPERIKYLINSYRVLLTRARQGMIIYIPHGNNEDITRPPKIYDGTVELFKSIGIEEI